MSSEVESDDELDVDEDDALEIRRRTVRVRMAEAAGGKSSSVVSPSPRLCQYYQQRLELGYPLS